MLGLDWEHFGLGEKKEEIGQSYDATSSLILRNAGMNFPLNILQEDHYEEAIILKGIAPERKKTEVEGYSLAILKKRIDVEEATFIRDWLFMKAPKVVATMNQLVPEDVIEHFMKNDNSFLKAGLRVNYYLTNLRQ